MEERERPQSPSHRLATVVAHDMDTRSKSSLGYSTFISDPCCYFLEGFLLHHFSRLDEFGFLSFCHSRRWNRRSLSLCRHVPSAMVCGHIDPALF